MEDLDGDITPSLSEDSDEDLQNLISQDEDLESKNDLLDEKPLNLDNNDVGDDGQDDADEDFNVSEISSVEDKV